VKGVVYFVAKILKKVEITKEKEVRTDWSEVYKEKQRNDSHKEPKKERKEKNINSAILLTRVTLSQFLTFKLSQATLKKI
jgi:hypothetical protein